MSLVSLVSHSPARGCTEQHDFSSLLSHQTPVQFLQSEQPQPDLAVADLGEECPHTEILDQEFDLSNETSENVCEVQHAEDSIKESQIYSGLYNMPSKPLENDFSISMVSHQITSPDVPEDYHYLIVSSVCHQHHQLEEDFSDPKTSILTHCNNIYHEILEEVKEITIVEDEDQTYTDIEALETIQEVSEVCDFSEMTETTETEFIEEIDNYPANHINDVDILDTISKDIDINYQTETIRNFVEEYTQSAILEAITEVAQDSNMTSEEHQFQLRLI